MLLQVSDEREHEHCWTVFSNEVLSKNTIALIIRIYIMWGCNYTASCACVILGCPLSNYLFNRLKHNRKSQEIRDCVMCSPSSRQFLPFTALSNYVFTFHTNIFQLLHRQHLHHVWRIVTFNVFIYSSILFWSQSRIFSTGEPEIKLIENILHCFLLKIYCNQVFFQGIQFPLLFTLICVEQLYPNVS